MRSPERGSRSHRSVQRNEKYYHEPEYVKVSHHTNPTAISKPNVYNEYQRHHYSKLNS